MDRIRWLLIAAVGGVYLSVTFSEDNWTEAQGVDFVRKNHGSVLPVSGVGVTDTGFVSSSLGDGELVKLSPFTRLRCIKFEDCKNVGNGGLKWISRCPQLETVWFVTCPSLSDAGLKELAGLEHLSQLRLDKCPKVTGSGLG